MQNMVSINLFGMARAAIPFLVSFRDKVLAPLEKMGAGVRVSGQLNLPALIDNPRSAEFGAPPPVDLLTEAFPAVRFIAQSDDAIAHDLSDLRGFPDRWRDDYRSLRNMLHQQVSLSAGGRIAADDPASCWAFMRPDLVYLDDFGPAFAQVLACPRPLLLTPAWLTCRGLNDRIAITNSREYALTYATRMTLAHEFVAEYDRGLHAERLLAYAIGRAGVRHAFCTPRAARCRIDGKIVDEDFTIKWRVKARTQARLILAPRSYAA